MRTMLFLLVAALAAAADPIVTEVSYNPASPEPAWEWVEIYNPGAAPLDLTGHVFDDAAGSDLGAANVAAVLVPAGGVAVLYNASITATEFASAWGGAATLVRTGNWPSLNNSGDTVGLWSGLGAYAGDRPGFVRAVFSVPFDDTSPWPKDDGTASIYLKDVSLDPGDGANWALSADGVAGAFQSSAAGGNAGLDVGSPGFVPGLPAIGSGSSGTSSGAGGGVEPVPEPGTLALLGSAWAVAALWMRRRR